MRECASMKDARAPSGSRRSGPAAMANVGWFFRAARSVQVCIASLADIVWLHLEAYRLSARPQAATADGGVTEAARAMQAARAARATEPAP